MAFGTQDEPDEVMNEINMTPLVDVMLVLLIIFIITVPVMKHAVNVDLPRASSEREQTTPETVLFAIAADGGYYWNDRPIADADVPALLATEAAKTPQPEFHIRGDRAVRYERVAQAMAMAREAGMRKIGFVTEPARAEK
jgi:biopolymer transport protein ExbD